MTIVSMAKKTTSPHPTPQVLCFIPEEFCVILPWELLIKTKCCCFSRCTLCLEALCVVCVLPSAGTNSPEIPENSPENQPRLMCRARAGEETPVVVEKRN